MTLPLGGGANRGLTFVPENLGPPTSPAMQAAYQYQAQAPNSTTDPATGASPATPALRYDNPNPNGVPYVKWDGYQVLPDGTTELIDRKARIVPYSDDSGPVITQSVRVGLLNQSAALAQNPGYAGVIEVPTPQAEAEARNVLRMLNIENISVRERPLGN